MNKRDLVITLITALLGFLVIILLIQALTSAPLSRPAAGGQTTPVGEGASPVSLSPGITTWSGSLMLTNGDARLLFENQTYDLFVKAAGQSSQILEEMGFKTGEQINILGKLTGNYIEVAGVNKTK